VAIIRAKRSTTLEMLVLKPARFIDRNQTKRM
jgi:hypothetical protein